MKILFTCTASHSHFRPLVPLARQLRAEGHDVRFAAIAKAGADIAKHGFEHLVMEGPSDQRRAAFASEVKGQDLDTLIKIYFSEFYMGILAEAGAPSLIDALDDWRPDLIVRETFEFAALMAAQKLGIRCVRHEILNGESEEFLATGYLAAFNRMQERVGVAPSGPGYLEGEASFTAHPAALDDTARVGTRAPLRYLADPVEPKRDVSGADWMAKGDAPFVYATFGTVAANIAGTRTIFGIAAEAFEGIEARILLTTGSDAPADLLPKLPPNVTVRPFVPQAEVLPHARLLICHGGSGTVVAGLAYGVPMVIAPMFSDQPQNARCVAAGGLGLAVPEATPERLRAAIRTALGDEDMAARATRTGQEIATMPSLAEAAAALVAG